MCRLRRLQGSIRRVTGLWKSKTSSQVLARRLHSLNLSFRAVVAWARLRRGQRGVFNPRLGFVLIAGESTNLFDYGIDYLKEIQARLDNSNAMRYYLDNDKELRRQGNRKGF